MAQSYWFGIMSKIKMLMSSSLHSACNKENMDKAFLICIYKIFRHVGGNHGFSWLLSRMLLSICCAHPNSPDFSNYGKSCCCWHEKSDLGTLWKLHVSLQLALKREVSLTRKSHETIMYGPEKLQHRMTFT